MSAPGSDPPLLRVSGSAYPVGRSQRLDAELVHEAGSAICELRRTSDGELLARAPKAAIKRQSQVGNARAEVLVGQEWRFETGDHAALDSILGPAKGQTLRKLERFRAHLILVVAAAVLGGFLVWRWGVPLLVDIAVAVTPSAYSEALDDASLASIDRFMAKRSTLHPIKQEKIRGIFKRLEAVAPEANYRLLFRNVPGVGPNAFALPGGTIIVTDALANEFPEPDIIAGILGHEMAHVYEDHSLKQLYGAAGTYLLVLLIIGDPGPVLEDILLEGQILLSLVFSREHEREADAIGLKIAADAGYDPAALATFFEKLEEKFGSGSRNTWLSTHPSNAERIAEIRRLAAELNR